MFQIFHVRRFNHLVPPLGRHIDVSLDDDATFEICLFLALETESPLLQPDRTTLIRTIKMSFPDQKPVSFVPGFETAYGRVGVTLFTLLFRGSLDCFFRPMKQILVLQKVPHS
jgi:hypothetical protein